MKGGSFHWYVLIFPRSLNQRPAVVLQQSRSDSDQRREVHSQFWIEPAPGESTQSHPQGLLSLSLSWWDPFRPRSSSVAGWSWPCAWFRHTAQSCSSPAWWCCERTGCCRSTCSKAGVRRTRPPAERPGSSWRWWWPGWDPASTARRCLSLRSVSPEVLARGWVWSRQGMGNLKWEQNRFLFYLCYYTILLFVL